MKYAMDVKVNLKPVFSNLVHTDWWEGPCRVGLWKRARLNLNAGWGRNNLKSGTRNYRTIWI